MGQRRHRVRVRGRAGAVVGHGHVRGGVPYAGDM